MDWFWHPHLLSAPSGSGTLPAPPPFAVVEFSYRVEFEQPPARVALRAGSTAPLLLFLNDRLHLLDPADGPVAETAFDLPGGETAFLFRALVQPPPSQDGRLAVEAEFHFPDGTRHRTALGPAWEVRTRPDFIDDANYNGRLAPGPWAPPVRCGGDSSPATAETVRRGGDSSPATPETVRRGGNSSPPSPSPRPLPVLSRIDPLRHAEIVLPGGAWLTFDAPFGRPLDAFVEIEANVPCDIVLDPYASNPARPLCEKAMVLDSGAGRGVFRTLSPMRLGGCLCTVRSFVPDLPVTVRIHALATA